MSNHAEDPVLQSARREALVVLITWLTALTYTVCYCYLHGYRKPSDELRFVLGFPDWVFWGIVVPWSGCFMLSWWFSYVFVADADLGKEADEGELSGSSVTGGDHAE